MSATIHAAVALVVMGVIVRTPAPRSAIRVFLYDPPPPPPAGSLMGATTLQAPAVAPVVPAPHEADHHVKTAHKPLFHIRKPAKPAAVTSEAPKGADTALTADAATGRTDGSTGGVAGGVTGGTVGGTGETLLPAEQAARLPVPISKILPDYPPVARLRGIEGQVVLDAIVATDGRIEPDITVVQSVPLLDNAAIAAVRQWRFRPARDDAGAAVRVTLRVPVRFVLR